MKKNKNTETMNSDTLGQVFTPDNIVKYMLKLRTKKGSTLEPSVGDGAFFKHLKNAVGIEIDPNHCPENALNMDFFDYSIENRFNIIIGNPPYVKYKNITEDTISKVNIFLKSIYKPVEFDKRTNLYILFIYKCLLHLNDYGELIFIVPREWLKSTCCIDLNKFVYKLGTITDVVDIGDYPIFNKFSPNCIIFKFVKGDLSRKTKYYTYPDLNNFETKKFKLLNGQLLFVSNTKYNVKFSDLFSVKVGGVSGCDEIFINKNGNEDFVYSQTFATGQTRKMLYNIRSKILNEHKDILINRKIKKFDESNWWKWGRDFYHSDDPRIYVNSKTRHKNPFFTHETKNYDGSILAIFLKDKRNLKKIKKIIKDLNDVDWKDLGFECNGRLQFNQKALENIMLPEKFKEYIYE